MLDVPMNFRTYRAVLSALKPLYDSVYNDNGDITVTGPYPYDEAIAGYFVYCRLIREHGDVD